MHKRKTLIQQCFDTAMALRDSDDEGIRYDLYASLETLLAEVEAEREKMLLKLALNIDVEKK